MNMSSGVSRKPPPTPNRPDSRPTIPPTPTINGMLELTCAMGRKIFILREFIKLTFNLCNHIIYCSKKIIESVINLLAALLGGNSGFPIRRGLAQLALTGIVGVFKDQITFDGRAPKALGRDICSGSSLQHLGTISAGN